MKKQTALKTIFIISIAGILFSGFLSYLELFAGKTACGAATCGATATINLGLPACVYGFIMYAIVFIIALLGLRARK
jgi:uncharacterized membrane protein